MSDSSHTLFNVRDSQSGKGRWVSYGDEVEGFVVKSYDASSDTLTLARSDERLVLRLPDARVQMARDEIVDGLARILGVSGAARMSDLLHPKLRSLFKEADLDSAVLRAILLPGSKVEVREISEEFARALEASLSEVQKAVGVRPTHCLWIEARGQMHLSFVVRSGDSWLLAPSVPSAIYDAATGNVKGLREIVMLSAMVSLIPIACFRRLRRKYVDRDAFLRRVEGRPFEEALSSVRVEAQQLPSGLFAEDVNVRYKRWYAFRRGAFTFVVAQNEDGTARAFPI